MLTRMHETRLQTRWTDFDTLGHITHAAYPVYLDEARDAVLTATVGPFTEFAWVIAHVSIDSKRHMVQGAAGLHGRLDEAGNLVERQVVRPTDLDNLPPQVMVQRRPDHGVGHVLRPYEVDRVVPPAEHPGSS